MYFVLKMLQRSRIEREAKGITRKSCSTEMKNDKISLDDSDFRNKCRACLDKGKIAIYGKKSNIAKAIKIISNVNIDKIDNLPEYLCRKCYSLLQGAIKFRKLIKKSEQLLKQLKLEPKVETQNVADNHSDIIDSELNEHEVIPNTNKQLTSEEDFNKIHFKGQFTETLNYCDNEEDTDTDLREEIKPKAKVKCKICNKEVTKYYYKDHLALHGLGTRKQKVKIECKLCNKTLEKAYYKKHLSAVHGKEHSKYICYVCGKTFKYQSGYKSHILSHSNDFPFKCQICPYRGRHSGLLKTHMRTHTRDYRFQCTECPARFLTSGNLNKHLLKHKERKHKCDSCSRAFHSKNEMEKHFQVDHMGIKNHVCNICEKAFGYRSAMMKHQLHVHKRQKMLNGRIPSYLEVERNERGNNSETCPEKFL